jgi:hypothetical protein
MDGLDCFASLATRTILSRRAKGQINAVRLYGALVSEGLRQQLEF